MLLKLIKITFPLIILSIALFLGYLYNTEETFYSKNLQNVTVESSNFRKLPSDNSINLLEKDTGKLSNIGWSYKSDFINLNLNKIKASSTIINYSLLHSLRLKKWNAITFSNKNYIGLVAFFDLGYLSGNLFHLSKIDINEKSYYQPKSYQYINPYYGPIVNHSCTQRCNVVDWPTLNSNTHSDFPILATSLDATDRGNFFLAYKANFKESLNKSKIDKSNLSVELDFKLTGKDKDSIVTLSPISEDSTLFYYNEKQYGLTANGYISINNKKYSASEFYIGHDIGRGVWPVKSGWNWVTANGVLNDGRKFGFNAGYGFLNPKYRFTEDCFFIDNKLFKIPSQNYKIDSSKLNNLNFYNYVFTLTPNQNSCEMTFVTLNKNANIVNLPIDKTKFEVKYGKFVGYCVDDKGKKYEIKEAYGIIENKNSIW